MRKILAGAAALGVAATAWAADPMPLAADPSTQVALDLVRSLGLPGVLVLLAFQLGRGGGIPVTVTLSDKDRDAIKCECAKHGPE